MTTFSPFIILLLRYGSSPASESRSSPAASIVVDMVKRPVQTAESSLSESSMVTCWSSATGIANTSAESDEPFHSLASQVASSVQWTERGFSESSMVSCRRDTFWKSASLKISKYHFTRFNLWLHSMSNSDESLLPSFLQHKATRTPRLSMSFDPATSHESHV